MTNQPSHIDELWFSEKACLKKQKVESKQEQIPEGHLCLYTHTCTQHTPHKYTHAHTTHTRAQHTLTDKSLENNRKSKTCSKKLKGMPFERGPARKTGRHQTAGTGIQESIALSGRHWKGKTKLDDMDTRVRDTKQEVT